MLAQSYSYLPLALTRDGSEQWYLVSDYAVAAFLRKAGTSAREREQRLAMPVGAAIDAGDLSVATAIAVNPTTPIDEAITKMGPGPVLVVDQENPTRLVGILTPYDLL